MVNWIDAEGICRGLF